MSILSKKQVVFFTCPLAIVDNMFRQKKERARDRLGTMQDLYRGVTNANWAALSLQQNGHLKHALQSWLDLNSYADECVQRLNEELIGVQLAPEEKLILDELNKLRAEVEDNYQSCRKLVQEQQNLQQIQQQQNLQQIQQQQHLQQIQQHHQQNHVQHTLRSGNGVVHPMRRGNRMIKSLRPGGATNYSTTSTPTSSTPSATSPTHSATHLSASTSNIHQNSASARHAANLIWSPSNSLTPRDEFADFSSTSTISDRSKAALKAAAKVKPPRRPYKPKPEQTRSFENKSPPTTNASRSNSPASQSAPPELDPEFDHNYSGGLPPSRRGKQPQIRGKDSQQPPLEAVEPSKDELNDDDALLKKIKGVDIRFTRSILMESNRDQDKVYWSDIAGLEQAKESLMETVVYPFLRPDLFRGLREPVTGMLLFGPPGTGKTMLARAAATESNSTFFSIQSSSLASKWYGESEQLVRALFEVAKAKAPSIIFVDEIDSILGQRSGDGEDNAASRVKNEFLVQWSDLSKAAVGRVDDEGDNGNGDSNGDGNVGNSNSPARVLVLAATNLPWAIDDAARRRFVRRQYIPLPEPETRRAHFQKLLSSTPNDLSEEDMDELVALTEGYSGSDITSLAKDAAIWPIRELGPRMLGLKEVEIRPINLSDFKKSVQNIKPSVNQEGLRKFEEWAHEFGSRG